MAKKRAPVEPRDVDLTQGPDRFIMEISGQPVSAGRPRVTRWGVYYPKTYTSWMAEVDAGIEKAGYRVVQEEGLFKVSIESVFKRPKKLTVPRPRQDLDNIIKGPLDMITKKQLLWVDDADLVELFTTKRYAEQGEEPWQKIVAERVG